MIPAALLTIILVALIGISATIAVMLGAAWHDLGKPHHARTWSAAFAITAILWSLPFVHAFGGLDRNALLILMPALGGVASAAIAIGFRQRAALPGWHAPLLGVAAAHAVLLMVLNLEMSRVGWVGPFAALNALMFTLAARTLTGRRRGERAAERIAESGLILISLVNLVAFAGAIGLHCGLLTLRLDRLAEVTAVLLPVIVAGIGLFTIILLTADLADQTRRLAATDMLTGVLNRRGFDAAVRTLLASTRRRRRPVALVLIDVDHFKAINDRFGHPAGDRVLHGVCQQLAQSISRRDIFARLGGEEFALIMTDVDLLAASCAVEVLRLQVETMTPDLPEPHTVTASFGVALSKRGDEPLPELFLRADRALYQSKAEGRNRVTIAA